jgi:hypothetical protein
MDATDEKTETVPASAITTSSCAYVKPTVSQRIGMDAKAPARIRAVQTSTDRFDQRST